MEQILQAYGLPKETITDIMILYKNKKAIVRLPDGDFFDIVAGVLRRCFCAIHVYNLPRLRTSNVNISNKRKWFLIKKGKKQNLQKLPQVQTRQMI